MPLTRKLAAEFIGTFWLVLGGCGSAVLGRRIPARRHRTARRLVGLWSDCRDHGIHDRTRLGLSFESGRHFRPGAWRPPPGQGNAALLDRAGSWRHRCGLGVAFSSPAATAPTRWPADSRPMVSANTLPGTTAWRPDLSAKWS